MTETYICTFNEDCEDYDIADKIMEKFSPATEKQSYNESTIAAIVNHLNDILTDEGCISEYEICKEVGLKFTGKLKEHLLKKAYFKEDCYLTYDAEPDGTFNVWVTPFKEESAECTEE